MNGRKRKKLTINKKPAGKKRKKSTSKKSQNRAKKRRTSQYGFIYMRSDNSTHFVDSDEEEVPVKTSYKVNYSEITTDNLSSDELRSALSPKLKASVAAVSSYRPIAKENKDSPLGKTTTSVETPDGTRLESHTKLRAITFFF